MIFNPVVLSSPLLTPNYFSCTVVHLTMREVNNNWAITIPITSVKTENNFAEISENTRKD